MKNQVLTFPDAKSINHELVESKRLLRVNDQCKVINKLICDAVEDALKKGKTEIHVDVSISKDLNGFAIEPEVRCRLDSARWHVDEVDNDTYRLTVKEWTSKHPTILVGCFLFLLKYFLIFLLHFQAYLYI